MADVNISKYRASVVRDGSKPASPGFVVSEGQDPVNPPGTNNFVPYTGATANVELGEFGIEAGFVTLDTTPTNIPTDQGAIYWDDTRSTAALIMNGTLQHIGQDSFFYVKNSSGSTIPKGTCVGFAGTDGGSGHLLVTPFLANGSVPSTYFMGVTCESIANGSFGQVMHFGELTGINTSGFTAGALLYASSTVAGAFQTTAPVAPNNIILVAAAVNSKNNGAIVVRPTLGSNINSDEGVKITSPTTGDLLQLQAGGLWENKTIDGAGIVTKATSQVISGLKTFNVNTLMMQSSGNANAVYLSNSSGSSTYQSGFNFFGFNTDNHIYFSKSSITGGNTGILAWSNTATRTYTLKDASGTLAFTSDIPSLSGYVQGSGTTNYVSKFTGSGTIGNSQIFDNGTNVGIGTASPSALLHVGNGNQSPINAAGNKLHIATTGTRSALVTLANSSGGTTVEGQFESSAESADLRIILGSTSNHPVVFRASNTEAMRLSTNLNLLVGTTSDTGQRLQVNGDIRINNGAADGGQLVLASSGFSDWNIDNFSGSLRAYYGSTEYLRLTSSGNLGLGVTPSAWSSAYKAIQFGQRGSIYSHTSVSATNLADNVFDDGVAKYIVNGVAGRYQMSAGLHQWFTAPSGTAGNAISFTQAMTLTSGGNLLVGTTTDAGYKLDVSGFTQIRGGSSFAALILNDSRAGGVDFGIYNGFPAAGDFTIRESGVGNYLVIKKTTGAATFSSSVTAGSTLTANTGTGATFRAVFGGTNVVEVGNYNATDGYRELLLSGSPISFYTSNAGASSVTERMRITGGGNVLIGTTTDGGARLRVAGDILIPADGRVYGNSATVTGSRSYLELYNSSTGDINLVTGFSSASIVFATQQGTERMRITSGGNVGIGTGTSTLFTRFTVQTTNSRFEYDDISSTTSYLEVLNSTRTASNEFSIYSRAFNLFTRPVGSNYTQSMTLTSGGNVLLGTTTDVGARLGIKSSGTNSFPLIVQRSANTNTLAAISETSGGDGIFLLANSLGSTNIQLLSNGTSILNGGNVLIGTTTSTGDKLRVAGNTFSNTIMTWNPENDNRSGVEWRFGAASTLSIIANRRLKVSVGGVEYWIAAAEV